VTKKGYFEGPGESRTYILPLVLVRAMGEVQSGEDDPLTKSEIVFEALCERLKLCKEDVLKENAGLLSKEASKV
jgi:hypothetical protein